MKPDPAQDPEQPAPERSVRAEARRNVDGLLKAAKEVFAELGVDAPAREIAKRAGVGVGTLYRHFPLRSDLIVAVFRHEMEACADAAAPIAAGHPPGEALVLWLKRHVVFTSTRRGLLAVLYSGDPACEALPALFEQRLLPALKSLVEAAEKAGEIQPGTAPLELLVAVARLAGGNSADGSQSARRMVALLVDGLRYRADPSRWIVVPGIALTAYSHSRISTKCPAIAAAAAMAGETRCVRPL